MRNPSKIEHDLSPEGSYRDNNNRLVCSIPGRMSHGRNISPGEMSDAVRFVLESGVRSIDISCTDEVILKSTGNILRELTGEKIFLSIGAAGIDNSGYAPPGKADMTDAGPGILHSVIKTMGIGEVDICFINQLPGYHEGHHDELIHAVEKGIGPGIIRSYGIGGDRPELIISLSDSCNITAVTVSGKLNACNLDAMENIIPACKTGRLTCYNNSVSHYSLLGNKLGQFSRKIPDNEPISARDVEIAVMTSRIASRNGMALEEMAYRYAFSIAEAGRIVVGLRDTESMEEILKWWNKGPLDNDLFETITGNIYKFY